MLEMIGINKALSMEALLIPAPGLDCLFFR